MFVTTTQTYINTLLNTQEVPSTPYQQDNLQELLSEFYNLVTNQYVGYPSSQVTNTQEGVEKVMTQTPQNLHHAINSLAPIYNTFTAINPSISATAIMSSDISERTLLFLDYDSDISPSTLKQLVVKW